MPVCEGCGGSFKDDFELCPYCGRAKSERDRTIIASKDINWDICEIILVHQNVKKKFFSSKEWLFEAIAIGAKGRYIVAISEPLICSSRGKGDYYWHLDKMIIVQKNAQLKLDNLKVKLLGDGWQPIGFGEHWYSEKFKHRI